MKNIWTKIGVGFSAFALAVLGVANHVSAAADTDLTSALASTTAVVSDNKGLIISFFVGLFAIVIVIKLAKRALKVGGGSVLGAMGGKGRRR